MHITLFAENLFLQKVTPARTTVETEELYVYMYIYSPTKKKQAINDFVMLDETHIM